MIESGTVFNHKGERWEVIKYDLYENKYVCRNLDSFNYQQDKFSESEIQEALKCKVL